MEEKRLTKWRDMLNWLQSMSPEDLNEEIVISVCYDSGLCHGFTMCGTTEEVYGRIDENAYSISLDYK